MAFEVKQRLDYPNFSGWSSRPIATSSNGDVLMALVAGGYMNSPPYYIVTASGAVVDIRPTGVPPGGLSPSALSNSSVILSREPVGFLQTSGAWAELPIPSSPGAMVYGMNSQGQVIGTFQDAHKNDEYVGVLANPSGTGPVTYTLVSLAEALAKAGLTGPGTALAINDAGWVLLAGNAATTYAIVNITNPNEPVVVSSNIPGIDVSTMSNSGWIAGVQFDDDGGGTAFELYNQADPAAGIFVGDASDLWNAAGAQNAIPPDNLAMTIANVNSSGQMVGTVDGSGVNGGDVSFGFCWDPENGGQLLTAFGLDMGAVIVATTAISDAGKIVATVQESPGGNTFGVILGPMPRFDPPLPKPVGPVIKPPFP